MGFEPTTPGLKVTPSLRATAHSLGGTGRDQLVEHRLPAAAHEGARSRCCQDDRCYDAHDHYGIYARLCLIAAANAHYLTWWQFGICHLFMHYNYCRVHQTIKTTPAVASGLADHEWDIEEIVGLLDSD